MFGRLCSLRDRFFDIMVSNPLFTHHTTLEESRDQVRHSSFKQMIQFYKDSKLTLEDYKKDPSQFYIAGDCFFAFDQAIAVKFSVHFSLYMKTIWNLGTAKHYYLVERAARVEDIGSAPFFKQNIKLSRLIILLGLKKIILIISI